MEPQIVIITGAVGGIGRSMVHTFITNGYRVILIDVLQDKIEELIFAYEKKNISGFVCDVTDETQIKKVFNEVYEKHNHIDILVNNAGMQYISPIDTFPTEKFRDMVDLMLTAPFISIKHVLPYMKKNRFGRIINMASINGLIGFAGKAAYNSAKHGLVGLTKVAALETADFGITVNAVCPGYVDTALVRNQLSSIARTRGVPTEKVLEDVIYPLVPQKRLLQPEEIAHMVLYLSGKLAGGITGQAIVMDGGYTAQ